MWCRLSRYRSDSATVPVGAVVVSGSVVGVECRSDSIDSLLTPSTVASSAVAWICGSAVAPIVAPRPSGRNPRPIELCHMSYAAV